MSDYERMRINERFNYGKQRSYRNGKGLGMLGLVIQKINMEINCRKRKKIILDI